MILIYEEIYNLNVASSIIGIITLATLAAFYKMKSRPGASTFWNYGTIFCIVLATVINGFASLDKKYGINTPG